MLLQVIRRYHLARSYLEQTRGLYSQESQFPPLCFETIKESWFNSTLKMYCSLVRSCIEYASPVWSDLTQNLTNLIESVQKRALRIILPSLAYEDALTRSGLETLASRQSNACQMFVEKMKSDDQPNNPIANILRHNIHNERNHSYNLRHEGLNRVRARTERFSQFITCKY